MVKHCKFIYSVSNSTGRRRFRRPSGALYNDTPITVIRLGCVNICTVVYACSSNIIVAYVNCAATLFDAFAKLT